MSDLAVGADGSTRMTVIPWALRPPVGVREYRFDSAGRMSTFRDLVAASSRITWAASALTSDGAVVAYRVKAKRHSAIRAGVRGQDGPDASSQLLSDPAHVASGVSVTASPGGAAAVVFEQSDRSRRWRQMIAIRPAGSPRFADAVPLSRVRSRPRFGYDGPEQTAVAFAADGSGAIAQAPTYKPGPLLVRRITVDGAITKAVSVDKAPWQYASAAIAVTDDGTTIAAFQGAQVKSKRLELVTTSQRTGSASISTPQILDRSDASDSEPQLALLPAGPSGGLLVSSGSGEYGLQIHEGPAAALTAASAPTVGAHGTLFSTPSGDGGTTITWSGSTDSTDQRDAIMATHRPPAGTWSTPAPLTKARTYLPLLPWVGATATNPAGGVLLAIEQPTGTPGGPKISLVAAP